MNKKFRWIVQENLMDSSIYELTDKEDIKLHVATFRDDKTARHIVSFHNAAIIEMERSLNAARSLH